MSMTQEQINADLFDQCKKLENELANTSDALKAADKEIGFLEQELATLRAKAEAYDKGVVLFGLVDSQGTVINASLDHSDNLNGVELPCKISDGLYLRKVRVCEEVEKPALATK